MDKQDNYWDTGPLKPLHGNPQHGFVANGSPSHNRFANRSLLPRVLLFPSSPCLSRAFLENVLAEPLSN